ncbi:zinc finger protein aebp2-like [Haliotis rubra]|uniref:zinc finger protein aebp2-like n=1 Tax=Haliotis rubra TaxID=36100 RepID=UPI001EE55022|nr:zinc finger protein aebp2-like [Haliotis rubra]
MAAVCMGDNGSLDSEDLAERNTDPVLFDMVKKNGINHNCLFGDKNCDPLESTVSKHEKMPKINGCSVKPQGLPAFTKPSIPTLRSRKDKISPEIPKRKRRASKQDISEPKEEIKDIEEFKLAHLELDTSSLKHEVPSPSEPPSAPCSEQVTPDTSRSCTPNPFLAPSAITIPSNKDSLNCKNCKTKVEEKQIPCRWRNCSVKIDPSINMLEHIRQVHVDPQQQSETFVCLWDGCKVYNKSSCSMSWLSRHIVCHSGHKPFKCIVEGCGQRFTTHAGLERHVNSHFNTLPQANQKTQKLREDTPTKLLRKRKIKRRRPQGTRTGDFFDNCIMARLQQELEDLTQRTQLDILGPPHSVTFHSAVIAKRTEESGKIKVLLHWTPEDILPDVWVPESQVSEQSQRVIPLTQLPRDSAANLHPSLYRHHRFRKHRRK